MFLRHGALYMLMALAAIEADDNTDRHRIKPRSVDNAGTKPPVPKWSELIRIHDPGSRNDRWAARDLDDSHWEIMNLPTHWESAGLPGFDGVVWFRRTVEVPALIANGEATLELGAIDDMDVTWINGKRVGGYEQPGDHFTPRSYKLGRDTLKQGRNTITVRVFDHGHGGGIAQTHGKLQLTGSGTNIPLTGPWRYKVGASLQLLVAPGKPFSDPRSDSPFGKEFNISANDVVALAGGTNIVKQFESGFLETLLTISSSERAYFRDMAWQADTVYLQQRPRNFGSHLDMLRRMGASIIIANFGQVEALDGTTHLPQFLEAYEELLDQFEQCTRRIVLVSPHQFEKHRDPLLPDLSLRNGDIAAYSEGIRQLAMRREYLYVDLSQIDSSGWTSSSSQLNAEGQWRWAQNVAARLTGKTTGVRTRHFELLRQQISQKNVLWRQHWRPTNWSFLYGNRQQVASSKDHRPGQPRWFPEEVRAIIPLIEKAEERIWKMRTPSR